MPLNEHSFCTKCGGNLEVMYSTTGHFICDTCGFEFNLDGIINEGCYDDPE